MAYVKTKEERRYEEPTQQIGTEGTVLTSGGTQRRGQSLTPGWVNLQRYVDINKPQAERMSKELALRTIGRGEEIEEKARGINIPQYDPERIGQTTEYLEQVREDPTQFKPGQTQDIQQRFQEIFQRQEQPDISGFDEQYQDLREQHREYAPIVGGLGEQAGRIRALQELGMGAGTRGGSILDAAIIGTDPTARETLGQAQREYQAPQFEQMEEQQRIAEQAQRDLGMQEEALRSLYGSYAPEMETAQRGLETAQQGYQTDVAGIREQLQTPQETYQTRLNTLTGTLPMITEQDIVNLPVNEIIEKASDYYRGAPPEAVQAIKQQLSAQIQGVKDSYADLQQTQQDVQSQIGALGGAPTLEGQFATPEEYARYQALQNLLQGIEY